MDIEREIRKRLPMNSDEHDGWVAEIWRRMDESNLNSDQIQNAARLNTLSAIRINDSVQMAARQIEDSTNKLGLGMFDVSGRLTTSIDKLTAESAATGTQLAYWTKWLAFGTFGLGAATLALVGVELWAKLSGH